MAKDRIDFIREKVADDPYSDLAWLLGEVERLREALKTLEQWGQGGSAALDMALFAERALAEHQEGDGT